MDVSFLLNTYTVVVYSSSTTVTAFLTLDDFLFLSVMTSFPTRDDSPEIACALIV